MQMPTIKKPDSSKINFSQLARIFFLSAIMLICKTAISAELTVNLKNINGDKGHILIALYSSKASYESGESDWSSKLKASKKEDSIVFIDLAEGKYAIKLYHDENDNQKLDFNFLGIPKEGYGFSNNVGRFGQPEYSKASFEVTQRTAIDISLF